MHGLESNSLEPKAFCGPFTMCEMVLWSWMHLSCVLVTFVHPLCWNLVELGTQWGLNGAQLKCQSPKIMNAGLAQFSLGILGVG